MESSIELKKFLCKLCLRCYATRGEFKYHKIKFHPERVKIKIKDEKIDSPESNKTSSPCHSNASRETLPLETETDGVVSVNNENQEDLNNNNKNSNSNIQIEIEPLANLQLNDNDLNLDDFALFSMLLQNPPPPLPLASCTSAWENPQNCSGSDANSNNNSNQLTAIITREKETHVQTMAAGNAGIATGNDDDIPKLNYFCEICNRKFISIVGLVSHKSKHKNIKNLGSSNSEFKAADATIEIKTEKNNNVKQIEPKLNEKEAQVNPEKNEEEFISLNYDTENNTNIPKENRTETETFAQIPNSTQITIENQNEPQMDSQENNEFIGGNSPRFEDFIEQDLDFRYPCNICQEILNSQTELESHLEWHKIDNILMKKRSQESVDKIAQSSTSIFKISTSTSNNLSESAIKELSTIITANVQRKLANTASSVKNYEKIVIVDGEQRYQCLACNNMYKTTHSLKYHHRKAHTGERDFQCVCLEKFAWLRDLNDHKKKCKGRKNLIIPENPQQQQQPSPIDSGIVDVDEPMDMDINNDNDNDNESSEDLEFGQDNQDNCIDDEDVDDDEEDHVFYADDYDFLQCSICQTKLESIEIFRRHSYAHFGFVNYSN